jgi:hypothetical protein
MRKAFDLKYSRISLLEVEAIPQSCIPSPDWFKYCFIYEKFVVESCDLCPSSQYILVRVIPSCFHFAKICLCQVSHKVQPEILEIFFLGELHVVYMDWGGVVTFLFMW